MLVYCITNKINGKQYIGMTSRTLEERWNSHCSAARNGSPFRFHSAIRKYGENNFKLEIIKDNLDVDECRSLEEQMIFEYRCMTKGYNAKPGGSGGWIVTDDKYDEWLSKISEKSQRESNGRWSGYSDEFILDECVKLFNNLSNKEDFSFSSLLCTLRSKYNKMPKSFSKNRFKDYKNSFKVGLSKKLGIPLETLEKLSRIKSSNHKSSLASANLGNKWYSNDELQISKQSKQNPGEGWVRGRKYGTKN